jgi:dTDP-glucose 4,6-dehydratase
VLEKIRTDSKKYVLVEEDICQTTEMLFLLKQYEITHIVHFAAQTHVTNSFEDSIKFTFDNVLGTHSLLEATRKYNKIQKFIHVSTDEVYGESMNDLDEEQKTEQSILCPTNPYAATKASAELIAQSYYHSYKLPIIITRGNNVYGPNQYPEKIISKFIHFLREDKKLPIEGNGSAIRSFLHVSDVVKAFEIILEKGEIGEIYNIGGEPEMEYSVLEIASIIIDYVKNIKVSHKDGAHFEKYIEYVPDRPYNDKRYYISNSKLKNLGWTIEKKEIKKETLKGI